MRKKSVKSTESPLLPMDLPTIEANIETGHYKSVAVFDSHFNSFFSSITKTYGRTSAMGIVALQLKKVFKFYFV